MQDSSNGKTSISNEFYLNFLTQTTNECYDVCIDKSNKLINFSNEEKLCTESCFSMYFVAYDNINKIANNFNKNI